MESFRSNNDVMRTDTVRRLLEFKYMEYFGYGSVFRVKDTNFFVTISKHGMCDTHILRYSYSDKKKSKSYVLSFEAFFDRLPNDAKEEILFNLDLFVKYNIR